MPGWMYPAWCSFLKCSDVADVERYLNDFPMAKAARQSMSLNLSIGPSAHKIRRYDQPMREIGSVASDARPTALPLMHIRSLARTTGWRVSFEAQLEAFLQAGPPFPVR